MVNPSLLDYIKSQLAQGVSKDVIKNNLLVSGGWSPLDVDEAFSVLNSPIPVMKVPGVPQAPTGFSSQPIKYAGFWIRWIAFLVDSLCLLIPGAILAAIFYFFFPGSLLPTSPVQPFVKLIGTLICWTYFVYMTNKYQATLGKMAVGIKVVSDDGGNLSLGKIILRETIGKLVSAFIFLFGYIMAGFTKKKQALHDKFAGSIVIHRDINTKPNKALTFSGILIFVFLAIGFTLFAMGAWKLGSAQVNQEQNTDLQVKAAVASTTLDSMYYFQKNNTLTGFQTNYSAPECSGPLTINISPDGTSIAVFGQSCEFNTGLALSFCQSFNATNGLSKSTIVDTMNVNNGEFDCSGSPSANNSSESGNSMQVSTTSTQTALPSAQNIFVNNQENYQITIPTGWVAATTSPNFPTEVSFSQVGVKNQVGAIVIASEPKPQEVNSYSVEQTYVADVAGLVAQKAGTMIAAVSTSSSPMYLEYTILDQGWTLRGRQYFYFGPNIIDAVSIQTADSDWSTFGPQLITAAESLKITQ